MSVAMGRMMELSQQGFCCSQILIILGLEAQGKTEPDLVRAMGGLCGGIGNSGKACGALTGGACLLGMYVGRGAAEEREHLFARSMMDELIQWFEEAYGIPYGGTDCLKILENNPSNRMTRCPQLVSDVFETVVRILEEHGISLDGEGLQG